MAAAVQGANSDEYANCTAADHSSSITHDDWGHDVTVARDIDFGRHRDIALRGCAPATTGGATIRLAASKLRGHKVINYDNEDLGTVEDFVLDMATGRPGYAILSFLCVAGTEKLLPVPITALTVDAVGHRLVLNADRNTLKYAPGFDRQNWPDTADARWKSGIDSYYRF
jgi:sporulation protein YlmC with PRC-barrel domain